MGKYKKKMEVLQTKKNYLFKLCEGINYIIKMLINIT